MSANTVVTQPGATAQRQRMSSPWFGASLRCRVFCGCVNFVTAMTFVQVVRRLFVRGISVEDTVTWWGAWSIVLDGRGRSVYQPAAQMVAQRDWIAIESPSQVAAWAFPPPHTFLLSPLARLSPWGIYALLTLGSAAVWVLMIRSMVRWARARQWTPDATAFFASSALAFSPAMGTIRYGSFSILVVGALWNMFRLVEAPGSDRSRIARASIWLAFAALKPQMIVFSVLGLVRRRLKVVVGSGAVLGALTIVICSFVGWGLLGDWFAVNRGLATADKNVGAPIDRMWTFKGVLTRLIGDGFATTAGWQLVFVLSVATLAFLWSRARTADGLLGAFAASMALQCFGFPYQSSYDAVLLVPAALLALDIGRRRSPTLAKILAVCCVVGATFVLSGAWNEGLPGLTWRFPLPALFVWVATGLIVVIAVHSSVREATDGDFGVSVGWRSKARRERSQVANRDRRARSH